MDETGVRWCKVFGPDSEPMGPIPTATTATTTTAASTGSTTTATAIIVLAERILAVGRHIAVVAFVYQEAESPVAGTLQKASVCLMENCYFLEL
eukprot:CAMPEP_0185776968 /NCGR_PEP_ID=MMETSP1174-20130828/87784_1 /TAXON_ID=35687 /ORGANISM="Dictyocha speculum, Strain CCMP1381" /LENGTH=93 /DNA_ID=CAMNT_0028465165 /DNA_START=572 /DNA_END=854 /DNA_ORIENTATION=-